MMPTGRLTIIAITWLVLFTAQVSLSDDQAESKIKNGKLLTERALGAQGDERADYIYKAKREFERAASAEPDNPWTYYWQAVVAGYLEGDSSAAEKLYSKALENKKKKHFGDRPSPWAYQADSNLLAALKEDFNWVKVSEEPQLQLIEESPKEEPKPDQIEFLSAMVGAGDFARAESLYSLLMQTPQNQKNEKLLLSGLRLKLGQDSLEQASIILADIGDSKGRRSQAYKNAAELYDTALDKTLETARDLERDGNPAGAEALIAVWKPYLTRPATPARGKLVLQYASATLAQQKFSAADSALKLYDNLGYDESSAYKNLKAKLTLVQKSQAPPEEVKPEVVAARPEKKPESATGFVTIAPPQGDIVKVVVNTINPTTGRVESSELWETAAPKQFRTGSSYKLMVQKKQERKAPKYIALAGILATFLIVR